MATGNGHLNSNPPYDYNDDVAENRRVRFDFLWVKFDFLSFIKNDNEEETFFLLYLNLYTIRLKMYNTIV